MNYIIEIVGKISLNVYIVKVTKPVLPKIYDILYKIYKSGEKMRPNIYNIGAVAYKKLPSVYRS